MITVNEQIQYKGIYPDRIIGEYGDGHIGPTIIFIGGIHGNEPTGVFALQKVFRSLNLLKIHLPNKIIGLSGNREALKINKRYLNEDLNRIWPEDIESNNKLSTSTTDTNHNIEEKEKNDVYQTINKILTSQSPPFCFIDLHTVSSQTVPFIVINDMLINRNLALKFPVPTIIGIEEFVSGTLLNHINSLGHLAIGFEAGNHEDRKSTSRHISFIWSVLVHTESISKDHIPDFQFHLDNLKGVYDLNKKVYEVKHRYRIADDEQFKMEAGYENFQIIKKGELLAQSNRKGEILAKESGRLFLPLYQNQGSDGFFIIQKMPISALLASTFLRKVKFESFLVILPGVSRHPEKRNVITINTKVARWFATELMHLLGFRRLTKLKNYLEFTRREMHS